jgi:hypothetical protein
MIRPHSPVLALALTVGLALAATSASAATLIWSDSFNHTSSGNTVPGWTEHERNANDVAIQNNSYLRLRDEKSGLPDAAAASGNISTVGYKDIYVTFSWRGRTANEGNETFNLAFTTNLGLTPANYQNWTTGFTGSDDPNTNNPVFMTNTSVLTGSADNTIIKLLFWTNVTNVSGQSEEGFLVDFVEVYGTEIAPAIPLPAGLPLLAGALGVLGWMRRRPA